MKMSEFLELSDDEKVDQLQLAPRTGDGCFGDYSKVTEDVGACSVCGKAADAGDFCFGCRKLVCQDCFDEEPHFSQCVDITRGE